MSDYILKSKNKRVKTGKGGLGRYKKTVTKKVDSKTNTVTKRKNKYDPKNSRYVSGPGSKTKTKKVTAKKAAKLVKRAKNRPLKRKMTTVGQRIKRGVKKVARKVVKKY